METEFCLAEVLSNLEIKDNLLSMKLIDENQNIYQNSYFIRNDRGDFDVIETEYF